MSEFARSLAVVVGINSYSNSISPLQTAVNDAATFAQLLRSDHGYEVLPLLDQTATLSQIQKLIHQTLPAKVGSDDRVLFYFAGHGVAQDGEDGPAGFLVPQDARPDNSNTFLSMRELHDALTALPCRHLLAILDCCFSGAFRWSSLRDIMTCPEILYQERYERFIQDPAWQVITSAAYDQTALDILQDSRGQGRKGKHSPFAEALFEALKGAADAFPPARQGKPAGDGVITATELYLYLRERVEVATEVRDQRQTPGLWPLRKHNKGEYIFLAPDHELNLPPAPELNPDNNPYRGLQAFEEKHADLFFGRSQLIEQLQNFVSEHPLTAVLGASGIGKSSLVKAGLIPQLRNSVEKKWLILPIIRPGESPITALARASLSLVGRRASQLGADSGETSSLVSGGTEDEQNEDGSASIDALSQTFKKSSGQFAALVSTWGGIYPQVQLLLVIDQFEELITLCRDREERKQFLNLLEVVLTNPPSHLRIVITLRSDFEPQFLTSALNLGWMKSRFIVPPMTQDELRQAIEEPAAERVIYFEPHGLVDQLINEVVQMPGALPLLSFTLSELYLKYLERHEDNRALTQADYEALGGVAGSLTQRADQEYGKLVQLDPAYEKTIRHVLLRMVTTSGGESVRRRVSLAELEYPKPEDQRIKAVIKRFSDVRLMVGGRDPEGNSYFEPAHDVLVQGWEKLQQWKTEGQENLALQQLLTPVAKDWSDRKQAVGLLWNANPRLDLLKQILNSTDDWLNQLEITFIRRSLRRRRINRLTRNGLISTIILSMGAATIIPFLQHTESLRDNIEILNGSSETLLQTNAQLDALLASIKASKQLDRMNEGLSAFVQQVIHPNVWAKTEIKTTATLHQALSTIRELNHLEEHSDHVNSVVFSPECPDTKQLIASASNDNTVKLWSLDGALLPPSLEHNDYVSSVSFSPDCQHLASVSLDNTIKLWHYDGALLKTFFDEDDVTSIRFSPDGQTIATVNYAGTGASQIKLWNLEGSLLNTFEIETHDFGSIDFSPDGSMVAVAGKNDIQLWRLDDGQLIQTFDVHEDLVRSVRFSPKHPLLASASNDGTIKLWRLDGTLLHDQLEAHNGTVNDLSFSPDGLKIVSVGEDNRVTLWALEGETPEAIQLERIETFEGHGEEVKSVSFSPDGEAIATASRDNSVKLWSLNEDFRDSTVQILGSDASGLKTYFSPDAQTLALTREDGKVDVWNLNGKERIQIGKPDQRIIEVSISPDGETIASTSPGATITLSTSDGKQHKILRDQDPEAEEFITQISFSPDGETLAAAVSNYTTNSHTIELWNLDSASFAKIGVHEDEIASIQFSPDGKTIVSASEDNTVKLWRLDGQLLKTFEGYSKYSQFGQTLRFSPNGKFLAFLASKDGQETITLWDFDDQELIPLAGHAEPIKSIRFSPDSKTIASTSEDHTVRLWSTKGQAVGTLLGHNEEVKDVIFHPSGRILASFSDATSETTDVQSEIRLWSISGGEIKTLTSSLGVEMLGIRFSQDGNQLIAADVSPNHSVMIWNLDHPDLIQLGCQRVNSYLQHNKNVSDEYRDICT